MNRPTKSKEEPSQINGLTDPKEIANVLNSFFANIGADLAKDFVSDENDYYWPRHAPTFEFTVTNAETIGRLIHLLSLSRSCDVDGITSKFVKDAGEGIIAPLVHICNSSIQHVTV